MEIANLISANFYTSPDQKGKRVEIESSQLISVKFRNTENENGKIYENSCR